MSKTKKYILLSVFAVVLAGLVVYLPNIDKLGLYRDDWNNFYNATVQGPDFLKLHYASDRPVDGILLSRIYRIFRTNISAYTRYNLACRIVGMVCFMIAFFIAVPNRWRVVTAGFLLILFPGYLQQIEGISYVPHQTAMLCFMISLLLTAISMRCDNKFGKVFLILFSCGFAIACYLLMEYYVGLEAFRLLLVIVMSENSNKKKQTKNVIANEIPFALSIIVFVIWRTFFFQAERTGTDIVETVLKPLKNNPYYQNRKKRMETDCRILGCSRSKSP